MIDTEHIVEAMAASFLADLRDRKLLKYLFAEEPETRGAYGYMDKPIDAETQQEIVTTLAKAALFSALPMLAEEFAKIADELGGNRVERGRDYSQDKHGRTDQVINAQRVRAQTIATAIRAIGRG